MTGVTPSGSGSQAAPEAAGASSPSVSIPNALAAAIAPFVEAAAKGFAAYQTVKASGDALRDAGLGRGFDHIYFGVHVAQSELAWADWQRLLEAWLASAMSAGTAETAQQAQGEARQRGAGTADAQPPTPSSRNPNP